MAVVMSSVPGDFTVDDSTGVGADLTSLFGVNQGVGQTPVLLRQGRDMTRYGEPGVKSTSTETTTVTGALQGFYALEPGSPDLIDLQHQLYAGGFYADKYYSAKGPRPLFGVHDDDTFGAFRKAVVQAARSGRSLPGTLAEATTAAAEAGDGAEPRPTIQLTSPTELRTLGRQVYNTKVGRDPSPGWLDRYVQTVHDQEITAQTSAALSSQAAGGGTYTASSDPSALAAAMAEQDAPGAAAVHQGDRLMSTVEQVLTGSPGSGG
jgi:hypothetical protein